MYNFKKGNQIVDNFFSKWIQACNNRHQKKERRIRKIYKHVRNYWMVYWFLLTEIFAIAMLGVGIHFMVAYLRTELPFGIVTDNLVLWIPWSFFGAGLYLGDIIATCGLYILVKPFLKILVKHIRKK